MLLGTAFLFCFVFKARPPVGWGLDKSTVNNYGRLSQRTWGLFSEAGEKRCKNLSKRGKQTRVPSPHCWGGSWRWCPSGMERIWWVKERTWEQELARLILTLPVAQCPRAGQPTSSGSVPTGLHGSPAAAPHPCRLNLPQPQVAPLEGEDTALLCDVQARPEQAHHPVCLFDKRTTLFLRSHGGNRATLA